MKYIVIFILIAIVSASNLRASDRDPEYLCALAPAEQSKPIMHDFIQKSYHNLLKEFPHDKHIFDQDFKDVEQVFQKNKQVEEWRYPVSWHTTVLYIGRNKKQMDTEIYKNFKPGTPETIKSQTFVYVPNKLLCSPVYPDITTSNNIPHVTLMRGQWSAVHCNTVLEALFYNGAPLESEYHKIFQNNHQLVQKLYKMNINKEKVNVYVLKFSQRDIKQFNEFVLEATDEYQYPNSPSLEDIFNNNQTEI